MNAQPLFKLNDQQQAVPTNAYYCGVCGALGPGKDAAELCCVCIYCHKPFLPGEDRSQGQYAWHYTCSQERTHVSRIESLRNAPVVPYTDGWVYSEFLEQHNNGYFESLGHLQEHLDDDDNLPPPFWPDKVVLCREDRFTGIDMMDDIFERLHDAFGYEDEELAEFVARFKNVGALKAAIDAFNAENTDIVVYYPDYQQTVVLPKPGDWKPSACKCLAPDGVTCDRFDDEHNGKPCLLTHCIADVYFRRETGEHAHG